MESGGEIGFSTLAQRKPLALTRSETKHGGLSAAALIDDKLLRLGSQRAAHQ